MKIRAPVRIDFGGPWTDTEYAKNLGINGSVVNASIDKYVHSEVVEERSDDGRKGTFFQSSVNIDSQIPHGAGLGGSSAYRVVRMASDLLEPSVPISEEIRYNIANAAYRWESDKDFMGIVCGWQDQYAAAFGGFNHIYSNEEGVNVERLKVDRAIIDKLEENLVLVYTGKSRLSDTLHREVRERVKLKEVQLALLNLRDLSGAVKYALLDGDLEHFAYLLTESWENQKKLADCVHEPVDKFFDVAFKNGAISGKACGAGGGGCLVFYASDREKLEDALTKTGGTIIPFKFEFDGLKVY